MTDTLTTIQLSGKEIFDISEKLANVLEDYPPGHAYMSCLFTACILMNPQMTPEATHNMIRETSKFMHLMDAGEDAMHMTVEGDEKARMN